MITKPPIVESVIPRIFHRVVPVQVPDRFEGYWAELQQLHPDWEFRTWQDPLNPVEFETGWQFASCTSGAQLAGLVRVEVVWRFGGIYVDMDIEPVRSFEPLRRYPAFVGTEDGRTLTDAVFGAVPGHPGLRACMDRALGTSMDAGALATGPLLMTAVLTGRDDVKVLPPASFYPAKFDRLNALGEAAVESGTFAVHHWHRSWSSPRWTRISSSFADRVADRARDSRTKLRLRIRSELESLKQRWSVVTPRSPAARGTYVGDAEVLLETQQGFPLLVSADDLSISPTLITTGDYHPRFLRFALGRLKPASTVIDVGANVGYYAVALARQVGIHGTVVAYEPGDRAFELLRKNVKMNELEAVIECRKVAVSDVNGELSFLADPERLGGASARTRLEGAKERAGSVSVPAESLDPLIADLEFVDLVKIDCEGGEAGVLRGMRRSLEQGRVGTIVLEVLDHLHPDWGSFEAELRTLVHEYGANVSLIGQGGELVEDRLERILAERHFLHVVIDLPGGDFLSRLR